MEVADTVIDMNGYEHRVEASSVVAATGLAAWKVAVALAAVVIGVYLKAYVEGFVKDWRQFRSYCVPQVVQVADGRAFALFRRPGHAGLLRLVLPEGLPREAGRAAQPLILSMRSGTFHWDAVAGRWEQGTPAAGPPRK